MYKQLCIFSFFGEGDLCSLVDFTRNDSCVIIEICFKMLLFKKGVLITHYSLICTCVHDLMENKCHVSLLQWTTGSGCKQDEHMS